MLSTEITNRAPLQLQFLLQEVASTGIHAVDLYLLLAFDQRNVLSKDNLLKHRPATCRFRWDSVLCATVLLHPEQSGSLPRLPFWKLLPQFSGFSFTDLLVFLLPTNGLHLEYFSF